MHKSTLCLSDIHTLKNYLVTFSMGYVNSATKRAAAFHLSCVLLLINKTKI